MAVRTPHLAVPFQIVGKKAAVVEQDSSDEVAQCVYAVLGTELGSRLEEPDFGITDPSFRVGGMDLGEALLALSRWEPRANVTADQEIADMVASVNVEVRT
jgi:phage baseplate assembly protein W